MLIVRSLYVLKSRSDSWGEMMEETLGKEGFGYTYTSAEKDVCIKRGVLSYGND